MNRDESCDWYHGKIPRTEAENILLEESAIRNTDGIFLVRESSSAANNYVLSVYYQNDFYHYQIQQHGGDAFFSIDGQSPIHGLDDLIEFYRNNSSNLCTKLEAFAKKFPPPVEVRRYGKHNLLHRATKHNHLDVVKEILKTTYRNLDAKDESGMTAVHLACKHRVNPEIMKLLIEKGATVASRDIVGNTPLHYACACQCKEMVEQLINANKNLIQLRNSETGLVPLHEAAKVGNIEIVKILLANNAPHMPRTSNGLFPKDFARDKNHMIVYDYLDNFKPPVSTYRNKWDHGTLDRKEALGLLLEKRAELYKELQQEFPNGENTYVNNSKEKNELTSGLYLVRLSERNSGYVISMLHNNDIKNYRIEKFSKYLYIDDGPYMQSLEHLIGHYMEFADGLPANLNHPVEPKPRPPVPIPPIKRKSFEISPSKLPVNTSQLNMTSPTLDTPSKSSKWMNSLPNMFSKKKKALKLEISKEDTATDPAALINSLKDLTFSTNLLPNELNREPYDVPPRKSLEPVDYFTESDKHWKQGQMKDNCIEEIYFVDPPRERENSEWSQLDPELYDTQKNLLKEINESTGLNYYVAREDLKFENEIGSGEFGNVFKGILRLPDTSTVSVAVKTLHKEHYQENLKEFLREAAVMIRLDNLYIVKLIGIAKGPPLRLVQELLPLGSLAKYLVEFTDDIEVKDINLWASQIAQGMEYLESKRFVHRDLAARNILLAAKTHAKISDFGLSRALGVDTDFYQSSTGGRWPLKWYAPENFFGTFSHASDVWSYGVTLWELYSKGESPYGDMSGSEVNELIEKGQRLGKPEICPEEIYNIMLDCWQYRDRLRPNFQFLSRFFNNCLSAPGSINDEIVENDESEKHSNTVYV